MEWSKIKNIVILILLTLNAILLVMVWGREYEYRTYQEKARSEVLITLASNGITLKADVMPEDSSLPTLQIDRESMRAEPEQAESLLGPCQQENESGGVRVTYYSDKGRMDTFSNGRFTIEFQPGAMPLGEKEPMLHGLEMLEKLSCQGQLVKRQRNGEELCLTFRQTWEGTPVFNCETVLTYRNGDLRRMEGQRLYGTALQTDQQKMITVPTLLIRFLGQRNESGRMFSQITSITPGYQFSGVRPLTLTPVWYVETDTGAYTLNGLDGKVL